MKNKKNKQNLVVFMDLQIWIDRRGGGSTISDEAWGAVDENGASGVPESKVLVPAELWVQIDRT